MPDRIQVNALDADTKWPSWTTQGSTTYAEAGVDTAEGARAVDAIKDAVHRSLLSWRESTTRLVST